MVVKLRGAINRIPPFVPAAEERQKKQQQKEKKSTEDKVNLKRSKTSINLFKKERKEKSSSKSPSNADKGQSALVVSLLL